MCRRTRRPGYYGCSRPRSRIQEWEHRALRAAAGWSHPALDRAPGMSYAESMDGSFPKLDRPHTVRNGRLVETTPEVNREVAESAMLLSRGARRAIEMKQEARLAAAFITPGTAGQAA